MKGTWALLHALLRAFAPMGSILYAFLHGIRIAGGHFACIFTWYSHSWRPFSMHFYIVFV